MSAVTVTDATCGGCGGSKTSRSTPTGWCGVCSGRGRYAVLDEAGTRAVERAESLAWLARHGSGMAA